MLGSLCDFININVKDSKSLQSKAKSQTKCYVNNTNNEEQVSLCPQKTNIENSKRRSLSGITEYKATDKSLIITNISNKLFQKPKIKQAKHKYQRTSHLSNHKPISQGKIVSFFHQENQSWMQDKIFTEHLKRQHNLLRAIVRTKLSESTKPSITHYENSLNRMIDKLRNIKLKFGSLEQPEVQQQQKTNRSLPLKIEEKTKSSLRNSTRLEFENCLSWAKKHKKNGSFYAHKLRKNISVEKDDTIFLSRKSMLQFIHQRSSSLRI